MLDAVERLDREEYDVPAMLAETLRDLDQIVHYEGAKTAIEDMHLEYQALMQGTPDPESTTVYALTQHDDLVQPAADLHELGLRQRLQRMHPGAAQTPVEGLGLVTKNVADLCRLAARGLSDRHGKGIVGIVFSGCHRQPDHQRSFLVEDARRQHQKRVDIAHFAPRLGIAIDPDDVPSIRRPKAALRRWRSFCRYQCSAPRAWPALMTSPP